MRTTHRLLTVMYVVFLVSTAVVHAASPDFSTAVGTVTKIEKETLTITTGEKPTKTVVLKLTGTSKFHLLSPQVRAGKTIITQRSAEPSDLSVGQSIAVIYTVAEKEDVLLTAVIKMVEKK